MPITTIGQLSQNISAADATRVVNVAHDIAGYLLIVFAVLIVAVSGPRRRSRVFAILFASAIVLVVVTGCASPAAAASPGNETDDLTSITAWFGAVGMGLAALLLGTTVAMVAGALRLLAAAWSVVVAGLRAGAFLGLIVAVVLIAT
ncbi:hypothetical protein [Cryptosporangium aurantiacum]|uniref:Uncharacterized protein n=1 Tax=Cryptosporangium aurantiacum TaxID=134849 RepID=A0A1M7NK43_9ACTN|nr:hypothetical protein [Cryptosporangium aurantiacum]SHN04245.1 hypothetical protein SAMN05443668_102689 [Cryptosporangium aurantiacum]